MTEDVRRARLLATLRHAGVSDERVLEAMAQVPRELFVPPTFQDRAYDNTALPIGHGQTVSQPEVVALMTSALGVGDRMKVLEIGTGSGYQTAVLALLCRRVYTIERHAPLQKEAEARLKQLRIHNVTAMTGDGTLGWPEQAPFDRIIVTAAADGDVPPLLLEQLGVGGIMIVPVAHSAIDQRLLKLVRTVAGIESQDLGGVRFVPLVSDHADDGGGASLVERTLARMRKRR